MSNSMKPYVRPIPEAIVSALEQKNNGAVDNGNAIKPIHGESRSTASPTPFGPITVKRLPAGDWSCDACHTQGSGWLQIEGHFKRTEHRVYTEVRPPR